jgi:pyridoxamine 5'-phosphate oxidase
MIHGHPNGPTEGGARTQDGAFSDAVTSPEIGASLPGGALEGGAPLSSAESFPPLTLELLGADPLAAFARWFEEARRNSNVRYPDAMTLSTVDEKGWPAGRILLLKGVDARGFAFFTNYRSAKGRGLEASGRGALTFYWGDLMRQVRAQGVVERLSHEESDEYFRSRPRGSQIGAWASAQSEPLESREVLESRAREVEVRFAGGEIPRPAHWGGYLLIPHEIEFWQEGESRLHDRFRYRRIGDGPWTVERLNP